MTDTTAYVANQGSNSVSVIDLTQNPPVVTATIRVGSAPDAAALSPDGSQLFVPNFSGRSLSIIATATDTVSHTVAVGNYPDGTVEVGGLVYVANLASGTISVVDPSTGTVTRTISLPSGVAPSGLAASSDGHTLYANDARNGRTYVIDLTQNPPVATGYVAVGSYPAYLSVAGSTGYVAVPGSNAVSVLDLSHSPPVLSGTVTVGTADYGVVALSSLGEVFATNSGSNSVSVIDTSSAPGAVVSSTTVGSTPDAIAVSPDQSTAVISNEGGGSVSVFHVNQAPSNTVPGTQNVDANGTASTHNQLTFSSANSNVLSTSDSDAGSNPVKVTLSVGDGTLTLSGTTGLTFTSGANASSSMAFTGDLTDVNNALAGLVYQPNTGFVGTDTLSLTVNDQGNTGLGKPESASSTVSIAVNNVPPTVGNVSYSGAVGNTTFGVGTSPSAPSTSTTGTVLSNSSDANGNNLSAVPGTITTAHGGSVSMNSDGTFTYQPPAGFTGNDTFTFQVTDGNGTSSGTATVTVAGMVWYVDNSKGTNGSGTSTSPFNTLSSVNPASGTGDFVFLFGSTTAYGGGLVMKSSQTLQSQSVPLVVGGQTLIGGSGSNATVTSSSGTGVTLAEGTTVKGISVNGTGGAGMSASSVNSFTLASDDTISNTIGDGLDVTGGNGTVSDGAAITTSSAHSISISGRTGGTITSSGAISDTGTGISLSSNSGATIDFTGGVTASTGTKTAFAATGGGTVNVTGSSNTLTTGAGTALDVESTTIGSSGLTFKSISSNGASDGIKLSSTGTSGGLTVTGTGSAGSGGTIQSSTADGVSLSSTISPSFTDMVIKNSAHSGINGSSVSGFTLSGSTVSGNGSGTGTAGNNEDGLNFTSGLTGTAAISNSTITGSADNNMQVTDGSGNLNLTVTSSTFSSTGSGEQTNAGMQLIENGTTGMTVSVTGSTFSNNHGAQFDFGTATGDTGTNSVTFNSNTVTDTAPNAGGDVLLDPGTSTTSGTTTFDIKNNNVQGAEAGAIQASLNGGSGSLSGTISGNTVGNPSVACSGSYAGNDVTVANEGSSTMTVAVENNHLYQYDNDAGLWVQASNGSATMNATITGNTIADPATANETCSGNGNPEGALWGLVLYAGVVTGDTNTVCADISGNSMTGSSPSLAAGGIADFEFDEQGNGIFKLPGYTGGSTDSNAVVSYVQANNSSGGAPSGDTFIQGTGQSGGYFFNTASCPTPST